MHFVVGWESKAISPIEIVAIFFAENAICSKGSPDNETTTALAFERMHVGHKHGETGEVQAVFLGDCFRVSIKD